ncbi:MAG TPA: IS3 family transposase [Woeseiaceae bacterium]|nr:IS3 family transposase [Woeseiaceae bacterium]
MAKLNLDIFWLKDDSLEDMDNFPEPEVLAAQIVENPESALEQFTSVAGELAAQGEPAAEARARDLVKSRGLVRSGDGAEFEAVFEFMKAHQATYPVRVMGRLLGVSASGFYAWKNRKPSRRALQDIARTARIRAIHRRSGEAYGAPTIHAELADDHDIRVGRKRVARLMRAAGKFVTTTVADPAADRALDKVDRQFNAEGPWPNASEST